MVRWQCSFFAAKEILLDDEKRASYHNEVDYEEVLLSLKRYKVILRSEGRWRRLFFSNSVQFNVCWWNQVDSFYF